MSAPESPGGKTSRVPFHELLGLVPERKGPGQGWVEVRLGPVHLRSLEIMHGGVAAAMLDASLGMAAGSLAPNGFHVVTVQLNVNFIRPAYAGEHLIARAEVVHQGRRTAVSSGQVRTADDELVAHATGTFMYLPRPDSQQGAESQQAPTSSQSSERELEG